MTSDILVTGGAGYVGSHTCKALKAAGYRPIAYDNLSSGTKDAVRWGPLVVGDVSDTDRMIGAMAKYRPSAVLHFAGLIAVGESVQKPADYYHANMTGLISLLQAMRATQTDQIVFSSSAAVYGNPLETPITEDHPKNPINPYAFSKYAGERMLADFGEAYGIRSISLRYFNASGADPDGEIGETHDPETHLIPLAIRAAIDPGFELTIFGTDYDTPDGSAVRDYIHVTDLADAHVKALGVLSDGAQTVAINLGTGVGLSVLEITNQVSHLLGRRCKASIGPRRAGDPSSLVADPARARTLLDWTPRFSEIETIIRTAATWEYQRLSEHLTVPTSPAWRQQSPSPITEPTKHLA